MRSVNRSGEVSRMSVLKKKGSARRKQLSIRVSAELAERIDMVRTTAKSGGMVFEIAEQLEPAIERIVKQAERELGILANAGRAAK